MIDYLGMVREFHETFNIPVSKYPDYIGRHEFARRLRLITEELSEYCLAVSADDFIGIADSLGDLLYVVFGTCLEHGLPMDKVFRQIHESNMTKVGGHKDGSGKWVKPDTYTPVDLKWLLDWGVDGTVKVDKDTGAAGEEGS
jgi:predicted HAD superfamily Cof-like phosphohydrolase